MYLQQALIGIYLLAACSNSPATVQKYYVETTSWQTTANILPKGVANGAFATYQSGAKAYIYVLGGRSLDGILTTVYYASINTNGNIISSWHTSPQILPQALFGATAVVYEQGPYLYMIAGRGGDNIGQRTVYYAAINPATGDIGAWRTAENNLPQGLLSPTSVLYQSPKSPYIYVVGGQDNQYGMSTATYYAAINPATGDIGAWQTAANNLPTGRNKAASVIFQARDAAYIYVIGGIGNSTTAIDTIMYTAIDNTTGNIGAWSTSVAKLPVGLYSPGSGIDMAGSGSAPYIYVLGGKDSSNVPQRNVYYASINPATGNINPFATSKNMLPQAVFNPAFGVYQSGGSSYLYSIGGQDANDNYLSLVYYTKTTRLPTGNIQVDYTSPLRTVNSLAFGLDETAYDAGHYLANDLLEQQRIKALHIKSMRLSLKYQTPGDPTSNIICEANGCDPTISGDRWLSAIRATGADPVLIVPLDATDAANLVKHFNKDTNNYVGRWIVYNEPNNQGMTAEGYSRSFNAIYDAMKAVDPSIKIGGPALSFLDTHFLQTFLTLSGNRVDFIDFHQYAEGATPKAASSLLGSTDLYEDSISIVRAMLLTMVPTRASFIDIQVGEWYLNDMPGDNSIYQSFSTVWAASVLGHILHAGGLSYPYGTKNNFLFGAPNTLYGATLDDPMPAYEGYGMFTGESLFSPFGSILVSTNTTLPKVEVYASDKPRNIVVINKDSSVAWTNVTFSLGGQPAGKVEVWQKDGTVNPYTAPRDLGAVQIVDGAFIYKIPAYSVTTFVVATS